MDIELVQQLTCIDNEDIETDVVEEAESTQQLSKPTIGAANSAGTNATVALLTEEDKKKVNEQNIIDYIFKRFQKGDFSLINLNTELKEFKMTNWNNRNQCKSKSEYLKHAFLFI